MSFANALYEINKRGTMMNIKKTAVLLAVMLMIGVVSACGNNSDKNRENNTDINAENNTEAGTDNNAETGVDSEAKSYVYISEINAAEYVTLEEYKGVEIIEEAPSVSQEDVDRYIDDYILASRAVKIPVEDRTDVREGDTANIDYTGYRDGEPFDRGADQGFDLVIGSGSFIPGFEEGLIGANVGDTVSLDLTFPENYGNKEMAGVSVTFEVTINGLSISELPELTDELVKELAVEECSTVEELNSYIHDYLSSVAMRTYEQNIKNDVTGAVMENCTFKEELPSGLIDRYYDVLIEDMTETAASVGLDLNTYVQNYYNMDEAAYTAIIRNNAQMMAKQYIMFQAISDAEGLNMTDEEKARTMEELAQNYGFQSVDSLKEQMDEESLSEYMMAEKVVAFLLDNATINTNEAE